MKLSMTALSTLALTALAGSVFAQATTLQSVGERMTNENAPEGVRVRSFLVIPSLDLSESYNDNVYATPANKARDFVTTVKPEVVARSNWSRHALNARVNATTVKHARYSGEDYTNTFAGVDGRLDVMQDTSVGGGVSIARNHEDRSDVNSNASAVKPTRYDQMTARAGVYRALGRANARLETQVDHYDYANNTTRAGALIDNSTRDRNEFSNSLRLGYLLKDNAEVYVRGTLDNRVYRNKATLNRSNRGQTVVAGAVFNMTGKTKADVFAGVEHRNYASSTIKDLTVPTFGAAVTWNATDLTSVIGSITRDIGETTLSAANSGFVDTVYAVDVEHALMRRLLLTAGASVDTQQYKGNGANLRDDKIYALKTGAKYYINRFLKAGAEYSYAKRNTNVTGSGYNQNTLMFTLGASY